MPNHRKARASPERTDDAAGGGQTALEALSGLISTIVLDQATELARDGRLAEAEELVRPIADGPSASASVLDLLARICAQQGKIDEAALIWQRLLRESPSHPGALQGLRSCDAVRRGRSRRLPVDLGAATVAWLVLIVIAAWIGVSSVRLRDELAALRADVIELSASAPTAALPPPDLRPAVKGALRSDARLAALAIGVEQRGRGILLAGEAPTFYLRGIAVDLTRDVPGVELVDAGRLTVANRYEVRAGDSLWSISEYAYGTPWRWQELARANGLAAPYRLEIGRALTLPH
jgi:nucleoid-associated protein YgaU